MTSSFKIAQTAILLIDMQDGFIYKCKQALALIPNQIAMLEFAEKNSIPVFVITCLRRGNLNEKISKKIGEIPTDILHRIEKDADSGFDGTKLNDLLKVPGTKNLILMGINAESCVLSTAKDAVRNGYSVITSKTLIDTSYYSQKNYQKPDLTWYKENGVLTKNHRSLIKLMKPTLKEKFFKKLKLFSFVSNYAETKN